jgi:cyanophycinase-like exopeptidase
MGIRWVLLLMVLAVLVAPGHAAKKNYTYYRVGAAVDAAANSSPGIVLMGGGTDVDAAFQWMCQRAGGGDFLVLRATGTDAYNPYVEGLCPGLNSVATLIVPSGAGAGDPFVVSAIRNAEAIWIAGGDQSDYVTNWMGTALQREVNVKLSAAPVGGTSAGMMVLTPFIYSALGSQGVTSSQALADPFNKYVTLARDLFAVDGLAQTIGDSHFVARDRMGRTMAFMCRVAREGWASAPRAIAIDEETALLVDGAATLAGAGAAYFLEASGPAEACDPKTPLTYANVDVYRITGTGTFDLGAWRGRGGLRYEVSATAGVLSSTQDGGSIY